MISPAVRNTTYRHFPATDINDALAASSGIKKHLENTSTQENREKLEQVKKAAATVKHVWSTSTANAGAAGAPKAGANKRNPSPEQAQGHEGVHTAKQQKTGGASGEGGPSRSAANDAGGRPASVAQKQPAEKPALSAGQASALVAASVAAASAARAQAGSSVPAVASTSEGTSIRASVAQRPLALPATAPAVASAPTSAATEAAVAPAIAATGGPATQTGASIGVSALMFQSEQAAALAHRAWAAREGISPPIAHAAGKHVAALLFFRPPPPPPPPKAHTHTVRFLRPPLRFPSPLTIHTSLSDRQCHISCHTRRLQVPEFLGRGEHCSLACSCIVT